MASSRTVHTGDALLEDEARREGARRARWTTVVDDDDDDDQRVREPESMERVLSVRDRLLAGRRVVRRATEWLLWDVYYWVYRQATRIGAGRDDGDGDGDGDGNAVTAAAATSSSSQEETSRGRDESAMCQSEVCRVCLALEKAILWKDFPLVDNLVIVLNMSFFFMLFICHKGIPTQLHFHVLIVFFIYQIVIAIKFIDTLAPAAEHQRVCSSFHWLWKDLQKLRNEKPGLHCAILCLMAFGLWYLGHINSLICYSIYGSLVLYSLMLQLSLKLFNKVSEYFMSHREWQCDSEIEDEFLPVVTEANLQVLNRVGETGDHSPTPTSMQSDTQNDSFYDEDFIEGLQEIAFNIPYNGEGSTDGVELSELELSVGENDAEENGIKFQTGHFEKSSSSSSEEEGMAGFDAKKIAVSSDESNGDSDFEIIDKEEIAKIEM